MTEENKSVADTEITAENLATLEDTSVHENEVVSEVTQEDFAAAFNYSKKVRSLYYKATTAYVKLIQAVREVCEITTEVREEECNDAAQDT